ncbi:MAG: AbiJ-NTD4 domain-containing protein [Candidatus Bathyarchaeia archaeon]|jgi:hypothetical protein
MPKFSERQGITKPKVEIQIESIDNDLRNCLWNAINHVYFEPYSFYGRQITESLCKFLKLLWHEFFKSQNDEITENYGVQAIHNLRDHYFKAPWYEIYDLIEFFANRFPNKPANNAFISECNVILERELSGYRFVGTYLTPITSKIEIEEIEQAISSPFNYVNQHFETALKLLGDKQSPDYRNSIKESISAVEAICKLIAKNDKTELGGALATIEQQGKINIHPALRRAFLNLYGYTSDADGIRHALKDEKITSDFDEAKFMLVACSAFVNYLVSKTAKSEIMTN